MMQSGSKLALTVAFRWVGVVGTQCSGSTCSTAVVHKVMLLYKVYIMSIGKLVLRCTLRISFFLFLFLWLL